MGEATSSGSNDSVTNANRGSGSFTDSFFLTPSSLTGQYSTVYASWNACTNNIVSSVTHNFFNWGNALQTQYGVIWENTCTAPTGKAYIITSLANCFTSGLLTTTLSSQFEGQLAINGSGQSNRYGLLKALAATSCAPKTQNKPTDSTNNNTFVQVSSITGSCNSSLSNTTVAQHSPVTVQVNCSQGEFLYGYPSSPGTAKTIQDRCPACSNTPGSAHFDNWNTIQGAPSCGTRRDYPNARIFCNTDGRRASASTELAFETRNLYNVKIHLSLVFASLVPFVVEGQVTSAVESLPFRSRVGDQEFRRQACAHLIRATEGSLNRRYLELDSGEHHHRADRRLSLWRQDHRLRLVG